jgi:hypothetical protein
VLIRYRLRFARRVPAASGGGPAPEPAS